MHDFGPTVSPYNGYMLRNLSKYYLFICCKQCSSTHFCHFLATAFVTDVLAGSNPSAMGPKRKGPHRWRPNNSMVGDEGCPRAAGAARAPLRACGPRVLRWKTLRVSSAPHPGGFESHEMGPNKNGPLSRTVSNSMVGDEGCPRAAGAARAPLRACGPRVLRWKTLRVSSAPHPGGFESHEMGPNKNGPLSRTVSNSMVGDEGFEPPALCV